MNEEELIDYLIDSGEAVEYGESWTPETTHEWWRDKDGKRHVRLVMTHHGGGSRGDDDEAEYARRLLDTGKAVEANGLYPLEETLDRMRHYADDPNDTSVTAQTHVIYDGKAHRFRYFVAPPEDV